MALQKRLHILDQALGRPGPEVVHAMQHADLGRLTHRFRRSTQGLRIAVFVAVTAEEEGRAGDLRPAEPAADGRRGDGDEAADVLRRQAQGNGGTEGVARERQATINFRERTEVGESGRDVVLLAVAVIEGSLAGAGAAEVEAQRCRAYG